MRLPGRGRSVREQLEESGIGSGQVVARTIVIAPAERRFTADLVVPRREAAPTVNRPRLFSALSARSSGPIQIGFEIEWSKGRANAAEPEECMRRGSRTDSQVYGHLERRCGRLPLQAWGKGGASPNQAPSPVFATARRSRRWRASVKSLLAPSLQPSGVNASSLGSHLGLPSGQVLRPSKTVQKPELCPVRNSTSDRAIGVKGSRLIEVFKCTLFPGAPPRACSGLLIRRRTASFSGLNNAEQPPPNGRRKSSRPVSVFQILTPSSAVVIGGGGVFACPELMAM